MNFETSVRIERPVDQVFDYVSDPRNFPGWNSAVQAVRQTSPLDRWRRRDLLDGAGATGWSGGERSRGRGLAEAHGVRHPDDLGAHSVRLPVPVHGRGRQDAIELAAEVELAGLAGALGPLASRAVKRGVDSNFADLKRILE